MTDLLHLVNDLPERSYRAGEVLLSDGSDHREVMVLIEGTLRIEKGGSTISTISRAGAVIGEVGILLNRPATATVVAATNVRVFVADDGAALLTTDPRVTFAVAEMLAERLDLVTTFLADLRQQYGDGSGSLAVVDEVLTSLMQRSGPRAQPGSVRDPDPLH